MDSGLMDEAINFWISGLIEGLIEHEEGIERLLLIDEMRVLRKQLLLEMLKLYINGEITFDLLFVIVCHLFE